MSFSMLIDTPVAIIGWGKSGQAAYRLLKKIGLNENVIRCFDAKMPELGGGDLQAFLKTHQPRSLIVSPGVPLADTAFEVAKDQGVAFYNEVGLAFKVIDSWRKPRSQVVGITGSVGKSTTTALIDQCLRAAGEKVWTGGNFGVPFCEYVSDVMEDKIDPAHYLVLELSSYQLELSKNFHIDYAIISTLVPNHLDRYISKEAYYDTKWSLIRQTKKAAFLCQHSAELWDFAKTRTNNQLVHWVALDELQKKNFSEARLVGTHNYQNMALVAALGRQLQMPDSYFQALQSFPGLEHRLERLPSLKGIEFFNDSKATTVDSVISAILELQKAFPNKRICCLLGGRDKKLPWERLVVLREYSNLQFYFFGEARQLIAEKSLLLGESFERLAALMNRAPSLFSAGDVVLLSPGGTSLDEFSSFEERGHFFKQKIREKFNGT